MGATSTESSSMENTRVQTPFLLTGFEYKLNNWFGFSPIVIASLKPLFTCIDREFSCGKDDHISSFGMFTSTNSSCNCLRVQGVKFTCSKGKQSIVYGGGLMEMYNQTGIFVDGSFDYRVWYNQSSVYGLKQENKRLDLLMV